MPATPPMLMHSTYFHLGANNTPDVLSAYMAEALQYLSTSKGILSFWMSRRAQDMNRPENDLAYDLAMHQIFQNEAAFAFYNGNDSAHSQFVTDVNRWAPSTTRRVIDTYITHFVVGGNASATQAAGADGNWPQSLFHSLYFSLTDKSPASVAAFTAICLKHLAPHPGIQLFATGGLTDIKRDVSVRNFDVGVNIFYESKQAYDEYLHSELHDAFFPATKGMIADTYIFDSYLKYESRVFSLTR